MNIILIDEPLENDQRALKTVKTFNNPIIIDCTDIEKHGLSFSIFYFNFSILLKSFFSGLSYWIKLYAKYKIIPKRMFFGLSASLKSRYKTIQLFNKIKNEYVHDDIKIIYANDLVCGLLGLNLSKYYDAKLIYDAHEVEFHRNRKNGLLRVVYDIVLEKEVVKCATEVIVVNQPIKQLYMDLYNIDDSKITVVNNNHFTPYMNYALDHFNSKITTASIVYVGGGIFGRQLEKLTQEAQRCNMKLHGFFIGDIPDFAKFSPWIFGDKEYINDLLALAKQKRLAMWCCTDDVCLSYKLSLPNKFFQAIAIGIPVIAAKDTYLADLVLEYHIGFIYDGGNFDEIFSEMQSDRVYTTLLESVAVFQKKIYIENLVL